MVGHGNFKLDDKFANNLVQSDEWYGEFANNLVQTVEWYAMDAKKNSPHKLFKRCLNSPKDSSTMGRSSQESRSVLLPLHRRKKPGQRRRKRAEKTHHVPDKRTKNKLTLQTFP